MSHSIRRRRAKAERERLVALPRVQDKDAAWALFWGLLGDEEYVDNHRSGFVDDPTDMEVFDERALRGCCGCFEVSVMINEREFKMACNYGH